MRLNFNGRKIDFQIAKRSFFTSKHSLKQLEILVVRITLTNDKLEKFLQLVNIARDHVLTSVDDKDNILKHWKIKHNSYSPNDKNSYITHNIEIVESELLQPTSLEIDKLVIKTSTYLEYFNGEQLTIRARTEITTDQQAIIKSLLNKKISVIRHGIDENPRQMVLLDGLWSKDNNSVKHEIFLVEANKKFDKTQSMTDNDYPLFYFASLLSAENAALLGSLFNILIDKKVLNIKEVNKIYKDVINERKEIIYGFYKVDDLNIEVSNK